MTLAEAKTKVAELTATQEQIKGTIDALIPESSRIAAQLRELTAISRQNRQAMVDAMQEVSRLEAAAAAAAAAEAQQTTE